MTSSPSHSTDRRSAFTLIETTLAVGIIAIVAIPAFSLMAVGSNLNLQSQQTVFVSQVVDQVSREVSQTDFSDLPDRFPLFAFDSEGIRLIDADDPERFYLVRVSVFKTAPLPGTLQPSENLARVTIDVLPVRSGTFSEDEFSPDPYGKPLGSGIRRHAILISRND